MRKAISVVLALGLLVGGFVGSAEAGKKKKKAPPPPHVRVVEGTYDNPAPGIGGILTLNGAGGTVQAPTLENENFVSIEVVDTSGTDVYFGLSQEDTDGDGQGEIIAGGCGKLENFPITAGLTHTVTVTVGPGSEDPSCVGGVASSGKVTLTLTEVEAAPAP